MNIKEKYNKISSSYDQRYKSNGMSEVGDFLLNRTGKNVSKILEIGCGTGYWLNLLNENGGKVFGLDLSLGMLKEAKSKSQKFHLVNCHALAIPLKSKQFDLIICVNMIHFLSNKNLFVEKIKPLLKSKGEIIIISLDLFAEDYEWYITKYFPQIFESDKKRYPSFGSIQKLLHKNNFNKINIEKVYSVDKSFYGKDVLDDPFINKNQSSQLALLSDKSYDDGLTRIKNDIVKSVNLEFRIKMNFLSISANLR